MKNTLLKLLYVIAYHIRIFKLFYSIRKKHQQIVLTYHNVISDDIFDDDIIHLGVSCSENAFIKQLNIILSRFDITTEIGIPGTCIISFDDGYRNNIEIAAHLLNAKNVSGLFFVPAAYFDNHQILWVDQLLMWVSYAPVGTYSILGNTFVITNDVNSRRLLWKSIYKGILSNYPRLESLIEDLNKNYQFGNFEKIINSKMYQLRFKPMTIEELDKMKKMGHKLGCHSYKHDVLSLLSDAQLEYDFSMCALHLKKYNTNLYSYPFGGENEISHHVINKCKKYGYSAAFLNYEKENQNIYTLGRTSLDNLQDKYFIEARLCGFESCLKKLISKFKRFKKWQLAHS